MRTRTLLSIILLSLLLWASCLQANNEQKETQEEASTEEPAADTEKEEEEEPKKEKTTEIEEEADVMVLHSVNFDRALSENQYLLVEFYAPWCGHCQRLAPIYADAAGKLKKEESGMRLAKVNIVEEQELGLEFQVLNYPTIRLFINGNRSNPIEYAGGRSAQGIIQWMKRRASPDILVLDTVESAALFIDSHNVTVVGFFDSLESEAAKVLKETFWDKADTEFAVSTSPEVFGKYEVKENSVVLFKKFDEGRADLVMSEDEKLDKSNVTAFIKENSMELIVPFNQENTEKIFTSSQTLHSLLFINTSVETQVALLEESRTTAKKFKGKMLFILIDVTTAVSQVLSYFGLSNSSIPTVRIINMETGKKFRQDAGVFTTDSLEQLCQGVVDGTAKPYFKTEEVPEDWNKGPVKVLVGKNFESVALDPTKNVFVEFYAPWCAHCKELAPIWEQLAEKYANKDDLIIAKIDATANEVESVQIQGFPTLKYFPAEGKEVVHYTGKRDLESLSTFLDAGGVLPQETDDEADKEDAEKEESEKDDDDDDKDKDTDESAEVPANDTSRDEL